MPRAIGDTKICSGCKEPKALTAFNGHKHTADKLQNWCKACKAIANRNKKYAMASGDYERQVLQQHGRCSICQEVPDKLYIDHCHKTNRLRALLCNKCNSLLGMCNDSIPILSRCITYIEDWKTEHAIHL